ncbi:carbamate kinase [Oceanobacillus polygoni]|uniref:Carbamate kinase n=1 Tax=Oceanobacillus polygoni TaxID=1235259 RepID=A0A9X0YQD7_9BACI|nr:carbamate kinase [Oceanobacillus polygoni]MBP2076995.1 carbamate kinase [Oceanobacillus polygoni]
MSKTIVAAIGGNAILQAGQEGTFENQMNNVRTSAKFLARLIKDGYKLVITHGNGPQVGNILRQNEEAADVVPQLPLDALSGQSQGFIGYMMVQCLVNEFQALGIDAPVTNLLTRVEVSRDDADFQNPSKPIGAFYSEEESKQLAAEKGWKMVEDSGRGYRRVVPSPEPLKIHEAQTIKTLTEAGNVVVACGGGGIPVVTAENGTVEGVEAVIDKDRSGFKLAQEMEADVFMILTDVENVYVNYGTPEQKALGQIKVDEMDGYVAEGQFSAGSMGPKVESALQFAKTTGTAIICSLEQVDKAIRGESGTIISK